jgi:hypothetical protein
MKLTNGKSFILGFTLCLLLVGVGVFGAVQYYLSIRVGGTKMPSTYTPEEISVFLGVLSGGSTMFNKDNTTEVPVSLPPLQENNTIVTKEYHINNMMHKTVVVMYDTMSGAPDGAVVTITYKMNDNWNVEGRQPYSVGTSKIINEGETLYFWVQLEDQGMSEGNYNFTMKFHVG